MTTISYDRPIKDFIDELNATGHVTHKSYKKTSVTFHHNAGRLSNEGVLKVWTTRPASAHFDVDGVGSLAQYVKALEYAWAAGTTDGNVRSIHIEMANSELGPKWTVAEATWKGAARLAGWLFANVIKARPTPNTVIPHHAWHATACPGPFIDSIWGQLYEEVVKSYTYFQARLTAPATPAAPAHHTPQPAPRRKTNAQIAAEVWAGRWGSGPARARRLTAAGYNATVIQALVNSGVGKPGSHPVAARKSISQLATEVIQGKWGTGPDRIRRLTIAGYSAGAVQAEVNRRLR